MSNKLVTISLLIFCQIIVNLACLNKNQGKDKDLWDLFIKGSYKEHWNVTDTLKIKYREWLVQYQANHSRIQEYEDYGELPKGMSIPDDWAGIWGGHGGQDPPPWAKVKANGKPDFCFQDPHVGYCEYKLKRWGYNSFQEACQLFNYSGCGGNENNFNSKKRCEETCLNAVQTNCEKDAQYTDY